MGTGHPVPNSTVPNFTGGCYVEDAVAIRDYACVGICALAIRQVERVLRALLARRLSLYAQGRGTAYDIAQNYALLSDRDRALVYLSASLSRQEPEIAGMKINPEFVSLRNMPESRRLLAAAGLDGHT